MTPSHGARREQTGERPGKQWAEDILQAFDGASVVYVSDQGRVLKDERTWQRGESVRPILKERQ